MATDDPTKNDPTVRELLDGGLEEVVDEATRAELERWFGLPSAEALEAQGLEPEPEDPDIAAVKERRAKAIEAVDPALLETVGARYAGKGERLIKFTQGIDVHVDPDIAMFDHAMLQKVSVVAEPRDVERPEDLDDDLKEVTPQALLRDLHRPETDFNKVFDVIDIAAEQKLDIVAEVDLAMKTSWKLPPLGKSPFVQCRELVDEVRRERAQSWPALLRRLKLTNRRVDE